MRALLALLLASVTLAAGCVTPGTAVDPAAAPGADPASVAARLSPLLGELDVLHEVVDVETPTGLVNVDVYRPDVPEGTLVPVILVASPYNTPTSPLGPGGGKDPANDNWITLPLYEWIREQMIPRGYAFAQMDILGTRNSGGCQGIMDPAERQATAATIEWLATQPWSSGKVGMIGKSYLGLSQIGAALENPEHLATIVPISAPTQDYAYHYYNGVPYLVNQATNSAYTVGYSAPPPSGDLATYGPRYAERFACYPETMAWSAASMGDYDAHWKARDYRPLVPQVRPDISMLFIQGLADWNVKPDHVLGVYNEWPGPKMALLGQWAHDYPNKNNFDVDAYGDRTDWYYLLHRWFDHWLKGIDTGLMQEAAACPVQSQASDATWRCLGAFPPQAAAGDVVADLTLYPTSDGALATEPGSGSVTYKDDNVREESSPLPGQIPFTWTVEEPTRIVGPALVNMSISTTAAFDHYATVALAVEENGAWREFNWGFLSLRHRDSLETPSPITPGASYQVSFLTYPMDRVLEPGQTFAVIFRGGSDAPNSGTAPSPTPGTATIDLSKTSVTFPTMSLDRAFEPLTDEELPEAYASNTR